LKLGKRGKEILAMKKAQQIPPMKPLQCSLLQRVLVKSYRGINLDLLREKIHHRDTGEQNKKSFKN